MPASVSSRLPPSSSSISRSLIHVPEALSYSHHNPSHNHSNSHSQQCHETGWHRLQPVGTVMAQGGGGGGGMAGMHWKGGVVTPPSLLQGAQPAPSHCPPDGKCQPQWHLYPTVTTPNRFGNLLQPLVQPLLGPTTSELPSLLMQPWGMDPFVAPAPLGKRGGCSGRRRADGGPVLRRGRANTRRTGQAVLWRKGGVGGTGTHTRLGRGQHTAGL